MRSVESSIIKNTNNDWGFGGKIVKEFIYPNGTKRERHKYFYRHAKPDIVNKYFDPDDNEITRNRFIELRDNFYRLQSRFNPKT